MFNLISEEKSSSENNVKMDENYTVINQNIEPYEILIVSHGAALKEIYKFLVFELKCKFSYDYQELEKSAKNTSISHFTFELNKEHCVIDNCYTFSNENLQMCHHIRIECNYLHRYDHLNNKDDIENGTLCDL